MIEKLDLVNEIINNVEISNNNFKSNGFKIKVGVDLGTCYIVIIVLDEFNNPIAYEMEYSQVIKDGLVVDYIKAVDIVKVLKKRIEDRTKLTLEYAATAIPPGTTAADCMTTSSFDVKSIYLVGGSSCIQGIENIIEKTIGIKVLKPQNPLLITPVGIVFSCNKVIEKPLI